VAILSLAFPFISISGGAFASIFKVTLAAGVLFTSNAF
jgi:hypothetical protein